MAGDKQEKQQGTGGEYAAGKTGEAGLAEKAKNAGQTGKVGQTGSIGKTGEIGRTGQWGATGKPDKTGEIGKAKSGGHTGKVGATADLTRTGQIEKAGKPEKPDKKKPKPDTEQQRLKKEEQARRSRRRNRQLIGFAVSILVIVGAVSIILNSVTLVRNMLSADENTDEYLTRFKAFVWFDIIQFDSVSMVDENSIKQIIIWSVLDDQMETLERDEYGQALVPVSEMELYAARIFGPDFRFSGHESFRDLAQDLTYVYDGETQRYTAPATGLMPDYLPTVVEVVRESGGVRRVVMGYVYTRTSDNQVVTTPDYEHPAKYMDYMLRRDGNNYYLYAVEKNTTHEVVQPTTSAPVDASLPPDDSSIAPPAAAPAASPASAGSDTGQQDSSLLQGGAGSEDDSSPGSSEAA